MSFFNLYQHNFIKVAAAVPDVKVADPLFNAAETVRLIREASRQGALLVLFPELGLSAYSCDDLFHQQALLEGSRAGLTFVLQQTADVPALVVVGLPLVVDSMLFNCAAVLAQGRILGVVPKSFLPNYREFYELRQFVPADHARSTYIDLCGQAEVPFGSKLLFQIEEIPDFVMALEICEDLWTAIPPSSYACLAGATVIANLSASNVTIGKDEYRRQLIANQSARCISGYVYSAAGFGESTTDLAWDGHALIYENGTLIAESERFSYHAQVVFGEIDLDRLVMDRVRTNSFAQSVRAARDGLWEFRTVVVSMRVPREGELPLMRRYERFPFVPSNPVTRDQRCHEIYEIQVQGLVKRLQATKSEKVVIGISGGLDSTQALIVCARAMDVMGLPRSHILAYTMPGFATSERTLDQARRLMEAIGCSSREIDIRPACEQMLREIGHPYADGKPVHDITFENVQAGERTNYLFRLANQNNAPVVGTSDLSELAFGWCTYGVGDHMAHYHVNASVPKTLIQFLIRYAARERLLGDGAGQVLLDVLGTPISPELVPGTNAGSPDQKTEEIIGPYELQDFHLYYLLRFGYRPTKIAFMAWNAWRDRGTGNWPEIPADLRNEYTIGDIKRWLRVLAARFFGTSQYKRSAMPNAPKVGSGGSLSPRGDYRAPSDSEARVWLADVDSIPDE
jgi:NAD+ synthase (glutamine-hydrolysing)